MFSSKTLISFRLKKDMDILNDMGVSKLSTKTSKLSAQTIFILLLKNIQPGCIKLQINAVFFFLELYIHQIILKNVLFPRKHINQHNCFQNV